MNDIEGKIRGIVAQVAGLSGDIPAESNLYLDLGVASVHALNLLTELETQFGVSVPDDDFVSAVSIATLTELMQNLTQSTSEHSTRV